MELVGEDQREVLGVYAVSPGFDGEGSVFGEEDHTGGVELVEVQAASKHLVVVVEAVPHV